MTRLAARDPLRLIALIADTGSTIWRRDAACGDVDAELFFPVAKTGPSYDLQVANARTVCARCPVRLDCLSEAVNRGLEGIWGGTTDDQRVDLRRNARAQAVTA